MLIVIFMLSVIVRHSDKFRSKMVKMSRSHEIPTDERRDNRVVYRLGHRDRISSSVVICDMVIIVRPHRSTTYVECRCGLLLPTEYIVICRSVCHTSEPRKNGCTDRDAVWVEDSSGPKEPCVRWGPDSPCDGAILRGKGVSHCKVRETLRTAVICAKTGEVNRLRCRLGYGRGWTQGIMC